MLDSKRRRADKVLIHDKWQGDGISSRLGFSGLARRSPASDATDVSDGHLAQARGTVLLSRQLSLASAHGGGKQHRSRTREVTTTPAKAGAQGASSSPLQHSGEGDSVVQRQGLAPGPQVARARASEETTATSSQTGESGEEPAPVSPRVIADAVYRMMCRDLTIERERRAGQA
jgi:hypothetical protein